MKLSIDGEHRALGKTWGTFQQTLRRQNPCQSCFLLMRVRPAGTETALPCPGEHTGEPGLKSPHLRKALVYVVLVNFVLTDTFSKTQSRKLCF